MLVQKVEAVCKHLSPVTMQAIRRKILQVPPEAENYSIGEALVFWTADWLTGVQIVAPDQVRLLIEEFAADIRKFGAALTEALKVPHSGPPAHRVMRLPSAKIGFLDRWQACMDGRNTFLDLKTGEIVPVIDRRPLETIGYNLTALFIRYSDLMHIEELKTTSEQQARGMARKRDSSNDKVQQRFSGAAASHLRTRRP